MPDNRFGEYLRQLRKSQVPKMTQADLGEKVGRTAMLINLIENGRNDPPQGELLNNIINAMELNDEEITKLLDLAALSRGAVPADILPYFSSHENLRKTIRSAMKQKISNEDWLNIQFGKGENRYGDNE